MLKQVLKWIPNEKIQSGLYELKYIKDDFNSLSICIENDKQEIVIHWDGIVESYRRSTEEARFNFVANEWQKICELFHEWAFFIMQKSDYRDSFYSDYGEFAEENEFTHYMIVTENFIIDIISSFEPVVSISEQKDQFKHNYYD